MQRVIWYFRQLFPLTYRSHYSEDSRKHFAVWRMWFGRVFDHEDYVVVE